MFGSVVLQDRRRTQRVVALAALCHRRPSAALPEQVGSLAALKAAYRLLASSAVTFPALAAPHWKDTRRRASEPGVVLLIQDTTELDYSHHPATTGLGPIGDGRGRGFLLQSVLAVRPTPRQVLGLAYQEPFLRQPAPTPDESSAQRKARPRESQVWSRSVQAVGPAPATATWVHVGDRYSDIFEFLDTCRQQSCQFLIRAAQDRRVVAEAENRLLFACVRALPAQAERSLALAARPGRPAREARVQVSFGPVTLLPPTKGPRLPPLPLWVVRVWEREPPAAAASGSGSSGVDFADQRADRECGGGVGAGGLVYVPVVGGRLSPVFEDRLWDGAAPTADVRGLDPPAGAPGAVSRTPAGTARTIPSGAGTAGAGSGGGGNGAGGGGLGAGAGRRIDLGEVLADGGATGRLSGAPPGWAAWVEDVVAGVATPADPAGRDPLGAPPAAHLDVGKSQPLEGRGPGG